MPFIILDQDGNTIEAALLTPTGALTVICRVRLDGDRVILYDLQVDGRSGRVRAAPPAGVGAGAHGAIRCPRGGYPWIQPHHGCPPGPPPFPARRPPALSCGCVAGVQASARCA